MAPKDYYKVHSLNKHIEDTKKGLSAEAQYNPRPSQRSATMIKKEPEKAIFGNNDADSDSSDSSDNSSDDEDGGNLLKKVIATAGKSTGPKRRSKEEEIADSDVERNATAKKAVVLKKEKQEDTKKSAGSGESSSESESDKAKSKPKVKTNGTSAGASTVKRDPSSTSSSEESSSEEESGDESSEEESDKKPAVAKRVPATTTKGTTKNNVKKEESSSESSESSESEEESSEESGEDEKKKTSKQVKAKATAKPTKTESSSGDSEDSESDDGEARADESMHMSDREGTSQVAIPKFIAPGFQLRKGSDGASGQDVAKIFNEANLQGKQFWYFTVPANVPISVVQNLEIPMDRGQLGDHVFSHAGQDFGVSFDSIAPKSSIQILIPSGDNSNYRAARHAIDQTMQVKRITQLGGAASSTAGPAPDRAPRPQPEGLKARYQPFGVNTALGNIGAENAEDVDMAETPTAAPSASKKDKKQAEALETPDVGRKTKRKHTASEEDAVAAAEQLRGETHVAAKKLKKNKAYRTSSPDLGSEPPSTVKKQTPIVPPAQVSTSASHVTATPPSKTAEGTAPKSAKKSKTETPARVVPQSLLGTGKKETPVPIPPRLPSTVPLPIMPGSAKARESIVPLPVTPLQKKDKKDKQETTIPSSQQEPPPSTQPAEKKKPSLKSKVKSG